MGRKEQAAAVRRLVREQVAAAEQLEPLAVRPVLEVLLEARKEMRQALREWIATVDDPLERFTAHKLQVMLRALEGPIETLGIRLRDWVEPGRRPVASALDRAMLDGLRTGARKTGMLAVKNLETEIVRLGHIFGQSLTAPQLDIAAIIARGNKLLFRGEESSAARYAGKVGEDLRFQLAVGVARGETFEQLTQRLRRLGGPTGPVAVRGIFDHPSAIIEDIPEGLFKRYVGSAERLVRTEMMGAYNINHREGIRTLNAERDKGDPKWLRRCDEAMDARTCPMCHEMDGKILRKNEGPPWHPNCRGIELAWREDWPEFGGISSPA